MTIHVTQEDIDHGRRRSCTNCPVALALERITGEMWEVGLLSAWKLLEKSYPSKTLPKKAHKFILAFDEGRKTKPFSFDMPI